MDFRSPVEAVIGGTRGRLLAVLAETTAPLTLRRLARLANVSPAQASRVMPQLVELGLVERSEVPPASQFVLGRENVAARFVLRLAGSREAALEEISAAAGEIEPTPVSVIVFGSVARGEADDQSDVDVVVIRPDDVDEDDERWSESVDHWRRRAASITGNQVELLEVAASEAGRKLRGRSELWQGIKRDGITVHGVTATELAGT